MAIANGTEAGKAAHKEEWTGESEKLIILYSDLHSPLASNPCHHDTTTATMKASTSTSKVDHHRVSDPGILKSHPENSR